jgi:hypothetical protein
MCTVLQYLIELYLHEINTDTNESCRTCIKGSSKYMPLVLLWNTIGHCFGSFNNYIPSEVPCFVVMVTIRKIVLFVCSHYRCCCLLLEWVLWLLDTVKSLIFVESLFGPKRDEVTRGWRKLHNEELHGLYSSPIIVRVIKARRVRWAGHVARMGEVRGA